MTSELSVPVNKIVKDLFRFVLTISYRRNYGFDVASKSKNMDQGGESLKKPGDVSATEITAETGAGAATAEMASASADPAARIDHWFDRQLINLYGEVANEPIPDEILSLINKLKTPH